MAGMANNLKNGMAANKTSAAASHNHFEQQQRHRHRASAINHGITADERLFASYTAAI
jgi:hypothetical protein